jgi:hypothetical protein
VLAKTPRKWHLPSQLSRIFLDFPPKSETLAVACVFMDIDGDASFGSLSEFFWDEQDEVEVENALSRPAT